MIVMGLNSDMHSLAALSDEEMTEQARARLVQGPRFVQWPELGQLVSGKSGANTDGRVVTRDRVASDEPEQMAADPRHRCAPRFHGDEQSCSPARFSKEFHQPDVIEMMQKQIRDHDLEGQVS